MCWEIDAFDDNIRLFKQTNGFESFCFSQDGYLSSSKGLYLTDQMNVAKLDASGTFTSRMWMGNNASLWTDNEGGNLVIVSPDGQHWHFDALGGSYLRMYWGDSSNEVKRMWSLNGETGLFDARTDWYYINNIPSTVSSLGSQFYITTSSPWGNTIGSHHYGLECEGGCSLALLKDNPNPGQLSLKLDGLVYQNEGQYRVMDISNFSVSGNTLTINIG